MNTSYSNSASMIPRCLAAALRSPAVWFAATSLFSLAAQAVEPACSKVAIRAKTACYHEATANSFLSYANCLNLNDNSAQVECRRGSTTDRAADRGLCRAQADARHELCDLIGEGPYDPAWDPTGFVADPRTLIAGSANSYLPLIVGTTRVYQGDGERNTVSVKNEIKLVKRDAEATDGVNCLVVTDLVEQVGSAVDIAGFLALEGSAAEDTNDWFAQDNEGSVWYCGEVSQKFERFAGDDPQLPELVTIEGSWKAFRDAAKPGIVMKAVPAVGDVYRQELSLEHAEDAAEVLATDANTFLPGDSCAGNKEPLLVEPAALFASHCAAGDCLVTRDFTPLDPEASEHKYYAPGVGLILEVDSSNQSCTVLVDIKTGP